MSGDFSESYMRAAINGEAASVAEAQASTRNTALNRAAFRLGTIPGMSTETAVGALMLAAGAKGGTKEAGGERAGGGDRKRFARWDEESARRASEASGKAPAGHPGCSWRRIEAGRERKLSEMHASRHRRQARIPCLERWRPTDAAG